MPLVLELLFKLAVENKVSHVIRFVECLQEAAKNPDINLPALISQMVSCCAYPLQ